MNGSAPYRSRTTSQCEANTNEKSPVFARTADESRHSSTTITAATASTASPSTVRRAAQARSGRFPRTGAAMRDSRPGLRTVRMSLARCKDPLSLDGQLGQRLLHLAHRRRRQRSVVERRGELLPVVDRPPEEPDQGLALHAVGLVLVDEQVGE